MGFFVQLTEAIAERQSLLMTGLDPNPEMLQSWAQRRGMGNRSFLSQARHWIKAVVEETSPHVCAIKEWFLSPRPLASSFCWRCGTWCRGICLSSLMPSTVI